VALFMTMKLWAGRLARAPGGEVIAIGSVAILSACLWTADPAAFPFPWGLPVVFATIGLIAMAVARADTMVGRLLASTPAVAVGKISYSLYLWHWPVFVLFRWTTGLESAGQKLAALVIAVVLAVASYFLVERATMRAPAIRSLPRGRAAVGGLAVVSLAAVMAGAMFFGQRFVSLSTVSRSADWDIHRAQLAGEESLPCKATRGQETSDGVQLYSWMPQGCKRPDGAALYAVGDSHAGAYIMLLRLYTQATGRPAYLATQGGCAVFDLKAPTTASSCRKQVEQELVMLDKRLKAGDVLLLASLRVDRLTDQWGGRPKNTPPADRQQAVEEAVERIAGWERRGVRVVFAAPTPVFRFPPFRCSDWFNAENPACLAPREMAREEMEALRQPAVAAMQQVSQRTGATVWDPLPLLCGDKSCAPRVDGRPTFFDGDHITGYGTTVVWPSFQKFMCQVEGDQRSCSLSHIAAKSQ